MAFHPDYATTGQPGAGIFYVYYTDNNGDTVVSRFQVDQTDPNRADENSETPILQVEQPYPNHNGGLLKFGPDGYLYVGLGDGGSAGDPEGHGQNLATLLGSILRLDVSQAGDSYDIPADNPFIDNSAARPEIWSYGWRNPWRFSFDRQTGDMYIADVGQNTWEEVNVQPGSSQGGENYGWDIMEGTICYSAQTCDQSGLVLPVFDYDHSKGCSITGGYVYRGQQFPELTGNYFVADFCSGIIWRLFPDGNSRWLEAEFPSTGHIISSFGEDASGELYVVDHTGGIYQIQPAD
jgi:glucose/arabinose dehydrogenase